ncbi:MAG TPA: NAD(P)/FAD-dependent oxidoreductase, partial [Bacillota bacterium]|nr:NAD(P)/FAD-dependent oxidoreductase [Bacillota bacterium]
QFVLERNGISDDLKVGNVSNEMIRGMVKDFKNFVFAVDGSLSIEKAFVTGGGIATKEIVPHTMGSKKMNRLYFCGEILDIHGYTGGYNITSALVTGRLAGTNASYDAY